MKKISLSLYVCLLSLCAFAQQGMPDGENKNAKRESREGHSGAYFNLSTGINNNGGAIGLGLEVPVAKQVSVEAGVGEGTWGYKMYACGKYYLAPNLKGWAFGPGITYSTGGSDFTTNLETIHATSEKVTMHLDPMTNIFVSAYRNWRLGRNYNRFYLQLGWSVALSTPEFYQTVGYPITNNSVKVMKFIAPGGLIAAVGFSFGGKKK